MTLFEKIETLGHEALNDVEHGAAWLVGMSAKGETALSNLEASSPLVAAAIAAGKASAIAHSFPLSAIEDVGSAILTMARELADSLSSAPPATTVTVSGTAPTVAGTAPTPPAAV